MKDFWNKRYSEKKYAYGTDPNEFFSTELSLLTPGKLLLPGEGEGRNAVWAAGKNWDVTAVDYSEAASEKALKLAENENVNIKYIVSPLEDFVPEVNTYDAVALVFVHLNEEIRETVHKNVVDALKPGGVLIAEFFSKEQIKNSSGGPKDIKMLYSLEDIYTDFHELDLIKFGKEKTTLNEGPYHTGPAEVIRITAKKL